MTQLILAISVRGYLPLIQKDSTNHMNGLAVYLKEGLPFARDVFLENCRKLLTYVFNSLYFTQYLTSFSCIDHFLLDARFFILFHLT